MSEIDYSNLIVIKEYAGKVRDMNFKRLQELSYRQLKYLKDTYLSKLKEYTSLSKYDRVFCERNNLKNGEYGTTLYMTEGDPYPFKKVYRISVVNKGSN